MANDNRDRTNPRTETTDQRPEQPTATPEAELLNVMQKIAGQLQPLALSERRRVLSSVATMLGVASDPPRQQPRQQPQQQSRGR